MCSGSDVEIHHLETAQPLKFSNVSVSAPGPLRASVDAEVKYGNSTINLTVSRVTFYKRMPLINIFRFRWMLSRVGISQLSRLYLLTRFECSITQTGLTFTNYIRCHR